MTAKSSSKTRIRRSVGFSGVKELQRRGKSGIKVNTRKKREVVTCLAIEARVLWKLSVSVCVCVFRSEIFVDLDLWCRSILGRMENEVFERPDRAANRENGPLMG